MARVRPDLYVGQETGLIKVRLGVLTDLSHLAVDQQPKAEFNLWCAA